MRFIKIIGVTALGIGLVVIGFVYDVIFAGIPYQDPAPELQAKYDFHSSVASCLYKAGGAAFVLGLLIMPFIVKKTRTKK